VGLVRLIGRPTVHPEASDSDVGRTEILKDVERSLSLDRLQAGLRVVGYSEEPPFVNWKLP